MFETIVLIFIHLALMARIEKLLDTIALGKCEFITQQEISLKKIFGGSQILTILTQLSDEIPLYSLSLHAGKGCSV